MPEVHPEPDDVEHRLLHGRVLEVEVGLVGEEPVPEELPPDRVEGPVGGLGVDEDDPRVGVLLVGVASTRRSRRRGPRGRCGDAWNHGCWSLVWFIDQVGDDPDAAGVRLRDQLGEVRQGAELGQHRGVVGDVVAAVAQRGGVERRQPEAVDAEPLEVVEPVIRPVKSPGAGARWSRRRRGPAPRRRRRCGTTAGRASDRAETRLRPCIRTSSICDARARARLSGPSRT